MPATWTSDDGKLGLRAFTAGDLEFLDRLGADPEALGPFEFAGIGDPRARRRRFEQDGYVGAESTAVALVLADGTVAGIASWYRRERGVSPSASRLRTGWRPSPRAATSPIRRCWSAPASPARASCGRPSSATASGVTRSSTG
jgi:hypothetical protein